MISVSYLFEGKVAEHLKKHWGKYAAGAAGVGALTTAPELYAQHHANVIDKDIDTTFDNATRGVDLTPEHLSKIKIAANITKSSLKDKDSFNILRQMKGDDNELIQRYGKYHKLREAPYNIFSYLRK